MGKKRREQVNKKEGRWLSQKEKLRQFKAAFGDWTADQQSKIAMEAKLKKTRKLDGKSLIDRWMEESGVTEVKDIDMSNPQISLEWKLCDPAALRDLKDETARAKFFETLTPEELDVYMNKTDENGASYRDLEGKKGFTKKNIAKSVVKFRAGKI